ncbi:MAG: 50S ribosome-binding GTPase [Candidatus Diapherotrites archaeon]|nr:50S ribosome-binding GTPase [Candidatus Diapherotrites archaeon]
MPANVSIEFALAQKKYEQARTLEEKLAALLEMQRYAPDHKGAEKLRAEISRKIRTIREKIEKQEEQRKKASARSIGIKKEGIGQIVLVGMPNSGKSTLLKALTNADVEIAGYAFTTKEPKAGMMDYNKAQIQLVEIPALIEGSSAGKARGTEMLGLIRNADAVVLVLDANNASYEFNVLMKELSNADILLNESKPKIEIKKSEFQGISIVGEKYLAMPKKELENFLKRQGLHNVSVIVSEPADYKKIEMALNKRLTYKKALAVLVDKFGNATVPEEISEKMQVLLVRKLDENELKALKEAIFNLLGKVLVFTKKPGEKPAEKPLALPEGSTIEDIAKLLHQDFYKHLKYAKVWGSTKFPGQKVAKEYTVKTGDIVELYC